jgi:cyclin H
VVKCRQEATDKFISRQKSRLSGNAFDFLSYEDSEVLLTFFERKLMDFCLKFKPPMPKSVIDTTFHYFKRFYLHNSVMDYHPKEML